jgi:Ca-activated chloride channel family protein
VSARRLAAGGAVLAALLAPAAAHAQQGDGRPAVGGGSFNDAPLLKPGRYRDSLRPGEETYYAFDVKPGQRLRVRAVVPGDGGHVPRSDWFGVSTASPMHDGGLEIADDLGGHRGLVFNTNQRIDFRTNPVDTAAAADQRDSFGGYSGPGAWFVKLTLRSTEETPDPVEVPVDFEVAVEGAPAPEPRASATPAPTRAPAQKEPAERGGTWAAGLLIAALAGLLVGLAIAALARRRSRPRPA